MILSGGICIITNPRMVACGPGAQLVRIRLGDIARVNVIRDVDSGGGSARWVAIAEKSSSEREPEGDVSRRCDTLQRGRELEMRIQQAIDDLSRLTAAALT